ncbi:hypothetical protein MHUMG1_09852 [Metarhizium humberi]|uniref:C2H2-type domain-containing protein n=1 Tax=Metarhizium humberi TaxID=2596975 RepID=A0A9P8M5H7_9HYPO|nr:hypothetical protein MHUMG1_09852 [Metarhizium humberi]
MQNSLHQGWNLLDRLVPKFRITEVILRACAQSLNNLVMTKHEDRNPLDADPVLRAQQQFDDDCKSATLRLQTPLLLAIPRRHQRLQSIRKHRSKQELPAEEEVAVPERPVCFWDWCGTMGPNSKLFIDVVNVDDIKNFPPPPDKTKSTGQPCEYCAKPLARSELSGKNWTRHVLDDVRPFTCLFETCDKRKTPFKDFESWDDHMTTSHSKRWPRELCPPIPWECFACGPLASFKDKADFEKHLDEKHGTCYMRRCEIVDRTEARRDKFRKFFHMCPLCHGCVTLTPDERAAFRSESDSYICDVLCGRLHRHIALSLCNLAFATTLKIQDEDGTETSDKEDRTETSEKEDEWVDEEDETYDEED